MSTARASLDLASAIDRDPALRPLLERAVAEEERGAGQEFWLGWSWSDVATPPSYLRRLLIAGVLRIGYQSRSQCRWLLTDLEAARQALRLTVAGHSVPAADSDDAELPAELFSVVQGLEKVKRLLRLALEADRPVHVLLTGPPASAKTVLLDEIAGLPGGRYALGGTTTRSGLVGYLLAEPGCRWLVIDELDKADGRDLSALLSVMETGRVARLQHGRQESERRLVRVFAGANRDACFPPELLSRFLRIELEPYGEDEFRKVVTAVLERREQCDPELAREIAELVTGKTNDVRDAVRIAGLARGDRRLARELAAELL